MYLIMYLHESVSASERDRMKKVCIIKRREKDREKIKL